MLCVTVFVLLLSINITEANDNPLWFPILNLLPEDLQWKAKLGIGAVWAYANSKKGHEAETVMQTVFDLFPGAAKKVTDAPTGELYLPHGLGYLCWSEGKASGANTIQRYGNVVTEEKDGITTVEVNFRFLNLVLSYNKCGFKKGPVKKYVKCKVNVGNHMFKAKFKVKDISNYKNMLKGMLKNDCIFTMVDFKLAELDDFGLEVQKRNGARASVGDTVLENVINTNTLFIQYMITRRARFFMYKTLKSTGSFICKDSTLDEQVNMKYPRFLEYISKPGAESLSPRFYTYCSDGQKPASDVETAGLTYYEEEDGKD